MVWEVGILQPLGKPNMRAGSPLGTSWSLQTHEEGRIVLTEQKGQPVHGKGQREQMNTLVMMSFPFP